MPNDNENKPISLSRARADKTGDARVWTVQDALEFGIELVKTSEQPTQETLEQCVIVMATAPDKNGHRTYHYVNAVSEEALRTALLTEALIDKENNING